MAAHSLLSVLLGQEKQGCEPRAPGGPAFHLVAMSEKITLAHGQRLGTMASFGDLVPILMDLVPTFPLIL